MFEKIVMKLARAKGPMTCPKCREKAGRAVVAEMVVTCEACGYRGSLSEWAMRGVEQELSGGLADPDRPPEGTRITRRELGGDSVAWEVPPSGRGGGLLGFGILWTGLVAVFSAFWVPAAIRGEVEGNMPQWMGVVFLVPFWVVGIVMLYFGLRFKYARHLVVVDLRQVVLVRSLFNRSKRRTLARKTLQAVEKREFYQQNYQPVHGIELRGDDGKLRFGTTLSEEEKNWLVADIRRTIWPSGTRGEMYGGEAAGGGAVAAVVDAGRAFVHG